MSPTKYADVGKCLKKRPKPAHKGQNGKVLVVGGSEDYVGAAALAGNAALAALRGGVDLVTVAAPEKVAWSVNRMSPDLITKKFLGKVFGERHVKDVLKLSKGFDAVLIGPGIGLSAGTRKFVRAVVKGVKVPVVVDADAIKAVKGMRFNGQVLLTPHAKEFETCFGKTVSPSLKGNVELVKKTSKGKNCVILLKGMADIVSDGKKVKVNRTGNEGMSVGGTGDVLAGICTGFVALGNNLFDSACAAAYANGKAGDILLRKKGYGFLASELLLELPKVIFAKKG